MLITKIITVCLDIHNMLNVFSNPANIKNILIDKYQGRCFQGCWIKSVDKIIEESECFINQFGPPDFGTMPIKFEVTGIIYTVGEVINGCVVINNDKTTFICSTEFASITLNYTPFLESVQKGQKISVQVGQAKYVVSAPKIAVNAVPFAINKTPIVYEISTINNEIQAYLGPMMDRIKQEEDRVLAIKTTNPKGWDFFNQLLYAYKEDQKAPVGAVELELLAPNKIVKSIKYLSRDPRINLTKPVVYGYTNAADIPAGAHIKTSTLSTKDTLLILLDNYYNSLRVVREMIEVYNTQELLEAHKNLWLMYKKAKS